MQQNAIARQRFQGEQTTPGNVPVATPQSTDIGAIIGRLHSTKDQVSQNLERVSALIYRLTGSYPFPGAVAQQAKASAPDCRPAALAEVNELLDQISSDLGNLAIAAERLDGIA